MPDIHGFEQKERVNFRVGPVGKRKRKGVYHGVVPNQDGIVLVQLDGDPYAVCVPIEQVEHNTRTESAETGERFNIVTTATAPKTTAKELRKQAKTLNIEGWEDMTSAELKQAIADAAPTATVADEAPAAPKRTRSKAAAAAPAAAKRGKAKPAAEEAPAVEAEVAAEASEDEVLNPYKAGSNLFHITEELLKGGKRSAMVKRLARKIELKPRQRAGEDYNVEAELDRRVLIVGQLLERDHGFTVTREGRGKDALIKAEKA